MALSHTSNNQYRIQFVPSYEEGEDASTQDAVSDAYYSEAYVMHSIHIRNPGGNAIDIQLSNMVEPDETPGSADWVTVYNTTAPSEIFMPSVQLFRWIRFLVTAGGDGTSPTVHILRSIRANS